MPTAIHILMLNLKGSRQKGIEAFSSLVCSRRERKKVEKVWNDFCKGRITFDQYREKRKRIESESRQFTTNFK